MSKNQLFQNNASSLNLADRIRGSCLLNPVLKQNWSQYVAICCNDSTYVRETTHTTQQENKSPRKDRKFSTSHALPFVCPFQLTCFDNFDLCIYHLCFITNTKVRSMKESEYGNLQPLSDSY